jgi:hypothetical protein
MPSLAAMAVTWGNRVLARRSSARLNTNSAEATARSRSRCNVPGHGNRSSGRQASGSDRSTLRVALRHLIRRPTPKACTSVPGAWRRLYSRVNQPDHPADDGAVEPAVTISSGDLPSTT